MDQNRLARIKLLSSRFNALQGLRVALAGATLAIVMAGYVAVRPTPTNEGALIALAAWFLLAIPGEWWLQRYYARAFGRQVSKPKPWNLVRTLVFFNIYFVIAMFLNSRFPAIPSGAPTAFTVALLSLWVAMRDWPWRAYYLGAPVAVVIALGLSAAVGGVLDPSLTLVAMFFAVGTSMVPIGLLDHRLLVKLVEEARRSTAPSSPGVSSRPGPTES
jgi:hypothetical protein